MAQLEEHIQRVNNKLQHMLRQYLLMQKENEKLKEKLKELKLTGEKEAEEMLRLQQQVSILKTSVGQMTETEKKAFDKQISRYIKEIDKCIGLLSE